MATFTWYRIKLPVDPADSDEAFAIKLNGVQGKSKADHNYTEEMLNRILDQDIKRLCWTDANEKNNKSCTSVIDTDDDFITVETLPPPNSILFPDISDFPIQKEIAALRKLMNNPEKHHIPLLRLAAHGADKLWEEPDVIHDTGWKILTDDSFPGVEEQRDIVRKALGTNNFAILEGPPGSGKTTVISEIILQMLAKGKRLLLVGQPCCHTVCSSIFLSLWENPEVPLLDRFLKNKPISLEIWKCRGASYTGNRASSIPSF